MLFNFDYFTKQMFETSYRPWSFATLRFETIFIPWATLAKSELSGFNANGISYPSVAWIFLQNAYA
jgi:hypothetical protein